MASYQQQTPAYGFTAHKQPFPPHLWYSINSWSPHSLDEANPPMYGDRHRVYTNHQGLLLLQDQIAAFMQGNPYVDPTDAASWHRKLREVQAAISWFDAWILSEAREPLHSLPQADYLAENVVGAPATLNSAMSPAIPLPNRPPSNLNSSGPSTRERYLKLTLHITLKGTKVPNGPVYNPGTTFTCHIHEIPHSTPVSTILRLVGCTEPRTSFIDFSMSCANPRRGNNGVPCVIPPRLLKLGWPGSQWNNATSVTVGQLLGYLGPKHQPVQQELIATVKHDHFNLKDLNKRFHASGLVAPVAPEEVPLPPQEDWMIATAPGATTIASIENLYNCANIELGIGSAEHSFLERCRQLIDVQQLYPTSYAVLRQLVVYLNHEVTNMETRRAESGQHLPYISGGVSRAPTQPPRQVRPVVPEGFSPKTISTEPFVGAAGLTTPFNRTEYTSPVVQVPNQAQPAGSRQRPPPESTYFGGSDEGDKEMIAHIRELDRQGKFDRKDGQALSIAGLPGDRPIDREYRPRTRVTDTRFTTRVRTSAVEQTDDRAQPLIKEEEEPRSPIHATIPVQFVGGTRPVTNLVPRIPWLNGPIPDLQIEASKSEVDKNLRKGMEEADPEYARRAISRQLDSYGELPGVSKEERLKRKEAFFMFYQLPVRQQLSILRDTGCTRLELYLSGAIVGIMDNLRGEPGPSKAPGDPATVTPSFMAQIAKAAHGEPKGPMNLESAAPADDKLPTMSSPEGSGLSSRVTEENRKQMEVLKGELANALKELVQHAIPNITNDVVASVQPVIDRTYQSVETVKAAVQSVQGDIDDVKSVVVNMEGVFKDVASTKSSVQGEIKELKIAMEKIQKRINTLGKATQVMKPDATNLSAIQNPRQQENMIKLRHSTIGKIEKTNLEPPVGSSNTIENQTKSTFPASTATEVQQISHQDLHPKHISTLKIEVSDSKEQRQEAEGAGPAPKDLKNGSQTLSGYDEVQDVERSLLPVSGYKYIRPANDTISIHGSPMGQDVKDHGPSKLRSSFQQRVANAFNFSYEGKPGTVRGTTQTTQVTGESSQAPKSSGPPPLPKVSISAYNFRKDPQVASRRPAPSESEFNQLMKFSPPPRQNSSPKRSGSSTTTTDSSGERMDNKAWLDHQEKIRAEKAALEAKKRDEHRARVAALKDDPEMIQYLKDLDGYDPKTDMRWW